MIAETICTIISFIEEKENTEHRIIKRYYSVLNNDMPFIEFYFLNKSIKSLNEEKDTKWSKISQILLKVAEFLTDIGLTYYRDGKISIKWYEYPSVVLKLKKFINSLNDRN